MRKLKYLLILSMIVICAAAIFVGCQKKDGVDIELTPNKITYCANGGSLSGKTERYLYLENGVHVPEPSAGSLIINTATRDGYKFVGWVRGELNEDGTPKLVEDAEYMTDGGVWMNSDGAITASEASKDESAKHYFYDYDRSEEFWNFSGTTVEGDIVLIALWENYNKYIFADHNYDEDTWEVMDPLFTPEFEVGSELYKQYEDRLYDVTVENGTLINKSLLEEQYNRQRGVEYEITTGEEGEDIYTPIKTLYTPIRYYTDPECTIEMFPDGSNYFTITDTITIIYYKEIKGDYEVVTNDRAFSSAILNNQNIYIDTVIVKDPINLGSEDVLYNVMNSYTYSGIIEGNGATVNAYTQVTQDRATPSTPNNYGGIFGTLDGATIKDLQINLEVTFLIAIDPDSATQGSALDANCYLGALAANMKNTTLQNVKLIAYYIEDRTTTPGDPIRDDEGYWVTPQIPNEFKVNIHYEQDGWQAVASDTDKNTIDKDSKIVFRPIKDKPEAKPDDPGTGEGGSGNEQNPGTGDSGQTPGTGGEQ